MEEPIYDFTFKEKYRHLSPGLYTLVFVLGLFCVPSILLGVLFTIWWAADGFSSDYSQLFLAFFIFLIMLPLLFFIFAMRFWSKEINNRYVFYENGFKVISGGKEYSRSYSEIVEIRDIKGNYYLYISDRSAYLIGGSFLGEITSEEFEQFLIVKTNIRPKKFER